MYRGALVSVLLQRIPEVTVADEVEVVKLDVAVNVAEYPVAEQLET